MVGEHVPGSMRSGSTVAAGGPRPAAHPEPLAPQSKVFTGTDEQIKKVLSELRTLGGNLRGALLKLNPPNSDNKIFRANNDDKITKLYDEKIEAFVTAFLGVVAQSNIPDSQVRFEDKLKNREDDPLVSDAFTTTVALKEFLRNHFTNDDRAKPLLKNMFEGNLEFDPRNLILSAIAKHYPETMHAGQRVTSFVKTQEPSR
jgi:hypothetical protein